jgi:hypothetical protein
VLETPENSKKRRFAVQTVASLSVSKLRLDGSRLAVMHANNDSLGVQHSGGDKKASPFVLGSALCLEIAIGAYYLRVFSVPLVTA